MKLVIHTCMLLSRPILSDQRRSSAPLLTSLQPSSLFYAQSTFLGLTSTMDGDTPIEEGVISPSTDQQQQVQQVPQHQPLQQIQQPQGVPDHHKTADKQQGQLDQHLHQQQHKQQQGVEHEPRGDLLAAQQGNTPPAAEDPQSGHSIDPRLDFTCAEFDPQLALQTQDLQLPVLDAPVLDNVSKCAGMVQAADSKQQQQRQVQQHESAASGQEAQAKRAKAAAFKQRALQATQRAEASVKLGSLHTIMTAAAVGPLAVLAKWHAAQQRIYVVTRHASGVRGRAVGTLVGFDKYMNLLLKDVEESYTVIVKVQRIKQQVVQQQQQQQQQQQGDQGGQPQQQQEGQRQQQQQARTRTRWCRKQQQRYRQLDQILLKGDNIVLVSGTPPAALQPPGNVSAKPAVAAAAAAGKAADLPSL